MANGGVTNAEKLIEEQKEVMAKTTEELKKEVVLQSESLHKRIAERRRRIMQKNSVNNSVCSEAYGGYGMGDPGSSFQPLMTMTNADIQNQMMKTVGRAQLRPMTTKGSGAFFGNAAGKQMTSDKNEFLFPNEISIINRNNGEKVEDSFIDDEQSFNQELLLMKLGNNHVSLNYTPGQANQTSSTISNTNSLKKRSAQRN